jgi:tetratricopeptide (TPR) repeat protein
MLVLGLATSVGFYITAARALVRADHQAHLAQAMNDFLNTDVLAQGDVTLGNNGTLTLMDAMHGAAEKIDGHFPNDLEVAARLHESVGDALASRNDIDGAVARYQRAVVLYTKVLGAEAEPTIKVRIRLLSRQLVDPRIKIDQKPQVDEIATIVQKNKDRFSYSVIHSLYSLEATYWGDHKEDVEAALPWVKASYALALADKDVIERDMVIAHENYAMLLVMAQHFPEADRVIAAGIGKYIREKGPVNPITINFRRIRDLSLIGQKRFQEAMPLADAVFRDRLKILGQDNPDTQDALYDLALINSFLSHWQEAFDQYTQILDLATDDKWDAYVLGLRSARSVILSRMSRQTQAVAEAKDVLGLAIEHYDDDPPFLEYLRYQLALVYLNGERWSYAKPILDKLSGEVIGRHSRSGDWNARLAVANARVRFAMGDRATAEILVGQALQEFKDKAPPDYLPAREAMALQKLFSAASK